MSIEEDENIIEKLVDVSWLSFTSMIELHNKPNFSYRYEICTILIVNAWELAIKASICKYISYESIYENIAQNKTITIEKCLMYLRNLSINNKDIEKKIPIIERNIRAIKEYRNEIIHYLKLKEFDSVIFSLLYRSCDLFVYFIDKILEKHDIIKNFQNFYILPIGFKIKENPFKILQTDKFKEENLTKLILKEINDLRKLGYAETILQNIDVAINNKKEENISYHISISNSSNNVVRIHKSLELSNNSNYQPVLFREDDNWKTYYPYIHSQVIEKLRIVLRDFKQSSKFTRIKKKILKDSPSFVILEKWTLSPLKALKKSFIQKNLLKLSVRNEKNHNK